MSERKPRNRMEQRAARAKQKAEGIPYTLALRLIREEAARNAKEI